MGGGGPYIAVESTGRVGGDARSATGDIHGGRGVGGRLASSGDRVSFPPFARLASHSD